MKKRKIVFFACAVGIIFLLVRTCRDPSRPNQDTLRDAVLASSMVQIIDTTTEEVLFECSDLDEIKWLSEVLVPDPNSRLGILFGRGHYELRFCKGTNAVVRLGLKEYLRFYWYDSMWEYTDDFHLTPESYGEVLPWLCEKSGKGLNELFPVSDAIKGIRPRPPKIEEDSFWDLFKRKPPMPHQRELEDDKWGQ